MAKGLRIQDITDYVNKLAPTMGLDPSLVLAVMKQESSFNPSAVSPKGAIGLMQLMPGTAKELGVNPYDPYQNLLGGMKYLAQQSKRFGGDTRKILAAYNGGPGAVAIYQTDPRYAETRNYVKKITASLDNFNNPVGKLGMGGPIVKGAGLAHMASMQKGQIAPASVLGQTVQPMSSAAGYSGGNFAGTGEITSWGKPDVPGLTAVKDPTANLTAPRSDYQLPKAKGEVNLLTPDEVNPLVEGTLAYRRQMETRKATPTIGNAQDFGSTRLASKYAGPALAPTKTTADALLLDNSGNVITDYTTAYDRIGDTQHFARNQALKQAAIGAAAGTAFLPGVGTLIGGLGGAVRGAFQGNKQARQAASNAIAAAQDLETGLQRQGQTLNLGVDDYNKLARENYFAGQVVSPEQEAQALQRLLPSNTNEEIGTILSRPLEAGMNAKGNVLTTLNNRTEALQRQAKLGNLTPAQQKQIQDQLKIAGDQTVLLGTRLDPAALAAGKAAGVEDQNYLRKLFDTDQVGRIGLNDSYIKGAADVAGTANTASANVASSQNAANAATAVAGIQGQSAVDVADKTNQGLLDQLTKTQEIADKTADKEYNRALGTPAAVADKQQGFVGEKVGKLDQALQNKDKKTLIELGASLGITPTEINEAIVKQERLNQWPGLWTLNKLMGGLSPYDALRQKYTQGFNQQYNAIQSLGGSSK